MINLSYTDANGDNHWPDAQQGSNLDYGVYWGKWLTNENDTFVSMAWDSLPIGIASSYSNDSSDVSIIQISADFVGNYVVTGKMTSVESGHNQIVAVEMHIEVV